MSKPIVLSKDKWIKLREKLSQDYPKSVIMVRWKMKDVLGFVDREYVEWNDKGRGVPWSSDIRLDFYNEPKRTMFLLKYSEYLDKSGNSILDIK